jgi:Leucine rich repeat N-terminal domain
MKLRGAAMLLIIVVVTVSIIGIGEVAGISGDNEEYQACPGQCACLGNAVDCSKRKLRNIPSDIPAWTEVL